MKCLIVLLSVMMFSTPTLATPVTFTGAELLSFSGVTFPTGTQTVVGDSLRIHATSAFSVVAALSLDQFDVDVSDFEVAIDITRLSRDDGAVDQNPRIFLSDGRNLFGAIFFDTFSTDLVVETRTEELDSDGQSLIFRDFLGQSPATTVPEGASYLATIGVQATALNTSITADIDGGVTGVGGSTPVLFDAGNGGPSLIFGASNFNENYLVNSITFTRGVAIRTAVPEPNSIAGLGLGFLGLGTTLHRRRKTK